MKERWISDLPGIVVDALQSAVGRIFTVILVAAVACGIGGITVQKSILGFVWIVQSPSLALSSLFFGIGIAVLPVVLIFTILYTRYEWPAWTLIIPLTSMWYLAHDTIDYLENETPGARIEKELKEGITEAIESELAKERQSSTESGEPESGRPDSDM